MNHLFLIFSLVSGCAYVSDKEYSERVDGGEPSVIVDCEDLLVFYADADGDGFGSPDNPVEACEALDGLVDNDEDCDDTDAEAFPGAVWYADVDGDGYGDEAERMEACEPDDGYVGLTGDCDDTNAAISPDAQEDCATEIDDDCSGESNQQDALGCVDFFADFDEDGFGGEESECWCKTSTEFPFEEGLDCNDGDDLINPEADEVCDDGVDNDCDGIAQGCGLDTALGLGDAAVHFVGAADSASGSALAYGDDVDGDGDPDLLIGGYATSQVMVVSGPVFDGVPNSILSGEPSKRLGRDIAIGDLNGDGLADMIIGAPRASFSSRSQGGVTSVYWGPVSSDRSLDAADVEVWGPDGNAYLGRNLSVGDINGDGDADLLVGALDAKWMGVRVGMVAVVPGPIEVELVDTVVYGDSAARMYGVSENDKFGIDIVATGDWTGDGIADVLVGARFANTNLGGVYGFESETELSGDITASDADIVIVGAGAQSRTGETLEMIGDVDDDGLDDFLVAAPERNLDGVKRGAVYVLSAMGSGEITAVASAELHGLIDDGRFGLAMTGIGDADGSGAGIAIGAPGEGRGKVFMFSGGLAGVYTSDDAIGRVVGEAFGGGLGSALVGNIDYDDDGLLDLIVGADGGDSGAGEVVVFLGGGL